MNQIAQPAASHACNPTQRNDPYSKVQLCRAEQHTRHTKRRNEAKPNTKKPLSCSIHFICLVNYSPCGCWC